MSKRFNVKFTAVIVGVVVDNGGTLLLMTLLATALVSKGLSEDEVMIRMKSLNGLILGLILGLGCTVLGGYVAGRMAAQSEILHGLLVAIVGMIIALVFLESGDPLWFDITGLAGMVPAGLIGGSMAKHRRLSNQRRTPV